MRKFNFVKRVVLLSSVLLGTMGMLAGCGMVSDSMEKAAVRKVVEAYKAPTGIYTDDTNDWEGQSKVISTSGPFRYNWKPGSWFFRTEMGDCFPIGNRATADVAMTMGAKVIVTDTGTGESFEKDCSMKAFGTLDLIKDGDGWIIAQVPELTFKSSENAPEMDKVGTYGFIEPDPIRIGNSADFRAHVVPAPGSKAQPWQIWVRSRSEIGTMQRWMLPGLEAGSSGNDYKSWFPSWPLLEGDRWGSIVALDSTSLNDPAAVTGLTARTFKFTVLK